MIPDIVRRSQNCKKSPFRKEKLSNVKINWEIFWNFCGLLRISDLINSVSKSTYLQSRGSENPNTGPIRDHSSFGSNRVTGSFAYINSGSPRRPQDKAHLVSNEFQATDANNPLCLR